MSAVLIRMEQAIAWITAQVTSVFLLVIVLVVLYAVVLRYVLDMPPFWSDRIGVFANMGMVLFGLSLTVRNRELIAMQGLYEKISPALALYLETVWNIVILIFALVFTWFGADAAANMPGQYWDFQDFCIDLGGGDEKGVLVGVVNFIEDGIGALVRPFCVDGAVPQRYLALLMPVSGILIVISCLAVLIEDILKISTMRKGKGVSGEANN